VVELSQAEGQRELDGREIALGREKLATTEVAAGLEINLGADPIAVGRLAVAGQGDPDPVVLIAAVVTEEASRPVVNRHDDVQVAIAVDVRVGRAAADNRFEQVRTGVLGLDQHVQPSTGLARVPEELDRLFVGLAGLHLGNLGLEVAIGRHQVEPAVQIVVEEEQAEFQRRRGRRAQAVQVGQV